MGYDTSVSVLVVITIITLVTVSGGFMLVNRVDKFRSHSRQQLVASLKFTVSVDNSSNNSINNSNSNTLTEA